MLENNKKCSTCKEFLPYSMFYPHKRMKLGLQPQCKSCGRKWHKEHKEYVITKNKKWFADNPEYAKFWAIKKKYNMTREEYLKLWKKQEGLCAGCKTTLTGGRQTCVDHNHKTKAIRGLLCADCNVSIGRLKENTMTLKRLVEYIEAENYA